jgi:lactate dehydrogenase-like 2-hydroxyacid dehydrogenase/phosphoserine aminotransferase
MSMIEVLKQQRLAALKATEAGPPRRTSNQFFGVGPITDATGDEVEARLLRYEFEAWLEKSYRKLDDKGRDLGPFTVAEIGRSMHRGYPADKVLLDMMREIHRYFGFPKVNKMAVGLGGGHSGFTVCLMHLMNAHDAKQHVFVDTPEPESEVAKSGGFFRQSWGAQIIEMQRYAKGGDEKRIHFAGEEGTIPSADNLTKMDIKIFVGVGHETTGATTYTKADISNLLEWLARDPAQHHAILDSTSMLGAMPWGPEIVEQVMSACCLFTPFQKAIGGISGYYIASFTPQALALIEANQKTPSWAIPRQLKLAAPLDAKRPLTGERSVNVGPIYDPAADKMVGGVINTYSTLAFAETTFGLLRSERRLGSASDMNKRSIANRGAINAWVAKHPLLELGVADAERRGVAVTLLRVKDADITDPAIHARIIARSKQILGYEGLTHPDGAHERGLDVARYVNAFPGTPGDYRAWIGGIRAPEDVTALLDNLRYAYLRAKVVVLEEELAALGEIFPPSSISGERQRTDDPARAYKVLVCDLVGLKPGGDGKPDHSAVRAHIEKRGGVFHEGPLGDAAKLAKGKAHFFYQPHLSTEAELLPITSDGQYDAVIAAATFLPKQSKFALGGVRIGAGTGNMACACWGGGNGAGGEAVLMNTPSFNSRATAQMVMKAMLRVAPNLDVDTLHARVVAGDFDTGKHLKDFPTEKLEGKRIAVIGYGNIGREVAKLAKAFGMRVAIHARPRHKEWIESEGFEFADTAENAARGADFISPHTGLGALDASTGKHANSGEVGASVLNAMNDGAVLINYDRGEVVDAAALDAALTSGKIRYACIDADLFVDAKAGEMSGPMVPYREMETRHRGRMQLLPHAAADTEHISRVDGARQAVDQIFDLIQFKSVTNLKGDLPAGYSNAGANTVAGVGAVMKTDIARIDDGSLAHLRHQAETMAAVWGAIAATTDADRRNELIARHGAALVKAGNQHATLLEKLGLMGPYAE